MAKKSPASDTDAAAPKKRRWYQNLADSYRIVSRTYKWIWVALIGLPVLIIGGAVAWGIAADRVPLFVMTGVMLALLADMTLLSTLLRPAMYKQIDGTVGAVYAVLSQIKRGWSISADPAVVSRDQDIVWRIVGAPGVVLISEGPSARVRPLLRNERKRIGRVAQNVPVIFIECGHDEGQVPLSKLNRQLRRHKKTLSKADVPVVAARLDAVGSKSMAIPRGVDPKNPRGSRRALRGS